MARFIEIHPDNPQQRSVDQAAAVKQRQLQRRFKFTSVIMQSACILFTIEGLRCVVSLLCTPFGTG